MPPSGSSARSSPTCPACHPCSSKPERTRFCSTTPYASHGKRPPLTSRSSSTSPLGHRTSSRLTIRFLTRRSSRWTAPDSSCRRNWQSPIGQRQEFDVSEALDWNAKTIGEFRANGGKVGGVFEGAPIILVHHRGRHSGREHVTPVMYLPHETETDVIYVFATRNGA